MKPQPQINAVEPLIYKLTPSIYRDKNHEVPLSDSRWRYLLLPLRVIQVCHESPLGNECLTPMEWITGKVGNGLWWKRMLPIRTVWCKDPWELFLWISSVNYRFTVEDDAIS